MFCALMIFCCTLNELYTLHILFSIYSIIVYINNIFNIGGLSKWFKKVRRRTKKVEKLSQNTFKRTNENIVLLEAVGQ